MTPVKPDVGHDLTPQERMYNYKQSSTMMCIERAFGILKGRFRELDCKCKMRWEFIPAMITACCIIHNILILSNDRSMEQILDDLHINETRPHNWRARAAKKHRKQ